MNRVTTSAQKTVRLAKGVAASRLRQAVAAQESVEFSETRNPDIYAADFVDGSKLYVASFHAADGRVVAMIDHKNIDETDRQRWHDHWRRTIDDIFRQ